MGYSTEFEGYLEIRPPLSAAQSRELDKFIRKRHSRDDNDNFEADYAPSLNCDWESDGETISWDGSEKSYSMFEWLQELDRRFFTPWGRKLVGEIVAQGERASDVWAIRADEKGLRKLAGRMVFEEGEE